MPSPRPPRGNPGGSPHPHPPGQRDCGHGLLIAVAFAAGSAAIGLGVLSRHPAPFLAAGAAVSLVFWACGQAFGAILTGQATDPNAGPLFVLLAAALLAGAPPGQRCEPASGIALVSARGSSRAFPSTSPPRRQLP